MWFIYFVLIRIYIKSFQGEMKKIFFLISIFTILSACGQSTALLGPSYTMAKTGSVLQAGNSVAASYGIKKTLNQSGQGSVLNSLAETNTRECQTIHSAELNEIFFKTLDETDCYMDPFSILR